MKLDNGLTLKEQRFIDLYLFSDDPALRNNGTQCALQVFDITNNDENTAGVVAHEYLRKPKIKSYIDSKLTEIVEEIDENWILKEIRNVYRQAVSDGKFTDSLRALELFGKYKAMWTDRQIQETEKVEDFLPNTPNGNDTQEDNESEINENTPKGVKNNGN